MEESLRNYFKQHGVPEKTITKFEGVELLQWSTFIGPGYECVDLKQLEKREQITLDKLRDLAIKEESGEGENKVQKKPRNILLNIETMLLLKNQCEWHRS